MQFRYVNDTLTVQKGILMVAQFKSGHNTIRVRISKSGQMTLPSAIRKSLGVAAGDYVNIIEEPGGKIHIEPANPLTIEELAGSLGPPPEGKTLTEYLEKIDQTPMVRSIYEGERDHNDRD